MTETKILALRNGDTHPTIETVVDISTDGRLVTANGLRLFTDDVLAAGDRIDDGDFAIKSIGTDTIEIMEMFGDEVGTLHTITPENIEWCDFCGDFHVYLDLDDDDKDEYTSGYADAIRDCVEYLKNSDESMVRNTLRKMNISYMSDLDTDAKIAEFIEKRFEKKPQLTLDELKEIVGYDFDLV